MSGAVQDDSCEESESFVLGSAPRDSGAASQAALLWTEISSVDVGECVERIAG